MVKLYGMFWKKKKIVNQGSVEIRDECLLIKGIDEYVIPFPEIYKIEALNQYNFLGNVVTLCISTTSSTYFISEHDLGFGEVQASLHNYFNFNSDFYWPLDHAGKTDLRILLYERKQKEPEYD